MSDKTKLRNGTLDDRTGEALATVLRSGPPLGPCLNPEEIDTLVERRGDEATRKRQLGHLASCEECLRSFAVAAELHREEQVSRRRSFRVGVPLALAALLVLAVSLRLSYQAAKPSQLAVRPQAPAPQQAPAPGSAGPATPQPAPAQAPVAGARPSVQPAPAAGFGPALAVLVRLPQVTEEQPGQARSFAGGTRLSATRSRYLAGGELLAARLSLARGEREAAADLVRRAGERLAGEGATPLAEELARLAADLPLADQDQLARRLEGLYTPAGSSAASYTALGAWTKAVLLAASADERALYATPWFTATGTLLASAPFPQEVAEILRQILAESAGGEGEARSGRLKALVRKLAELT